MPPSYATGMPASTGRRFRSGSAKFEKTYNEPVTVAAAETFGTSRTLG
jgi:hypothetical protein